MTHEKTVFFADWNAYAGPSLAQKAAARLKKVSAVQTSAHH
jgi:hypothetical protein